MGPSTMLFVYFKAPFIYVMRDDVNYFKFESIHAGRGPSKLFPVIGNDYLLNNASSHFTSSLPPPRDTLSHPFKNALISATTPLTLGSLTAFSAFPSAAGKL